MRNWVLGAFFGLCHGAQADIVGVDDRFEVDPMERPFAAMMGYDHNGEWIIFGNAWQTGHPRVLVTARHLLTHEEDNGVLRWSINQSFERPTAEELHPYEVRVAGCPNDPPYVIEEILEVGNFANPGSHADWLVVLLDRPSCLRQDQLARRLNISDELRHRLMFAENAPIEARVDGFFDRNMIGVSIDHGLEWTMENNALFTGFGRIPGHYYQRVIGQSTFIANAYEYGEPNVVRLFKFTGDTDQGISGSAVSAIGRFEFQGQMISVDHVVGILVVEAGSPEIEMNYLTIYEGPFQEAVERAIAEAEARYPTGWATD